MIQTPYTRRARHMIAALAFVALGACEGGFDSDFRGLSGGFTTSPAAQNATQSRPAPDGRGVISYPNYQVALARRGDTVTDVANRVGLDAASLARFNGLAPDTPMRAGEVIALPGRIPELSSATGAAQARPSQPETVDVTALAGDAIATSPATPQAQTRPDTQSPAVGAEPIRHQVQRGETAYSVARLYNVPVRALAQWNGLGAQYSIREGQFLLIPPKTGRAPTPAAPTDPGAGSQTPVPPSAAQPLPEETLAPAEPGAAQVDLGPQTAQSASARLAYPVEGNIIRDYNKGRNDGINIKGTPGAAVKAADAGTVAAITESADGVPIVVLRHAENLLTVYANVADVLVEKGTQVRRGQMIAKLRQGDQSFVHFEVRQGFESVDPDQYLN